MDDSRPKSEDQADLVAPAASKQVSIRTAPDSDVEPQAVNDIIVNFTGDQFLVSFARALPPTFRGPDEIPDAIESKVLFRAVVSTRKWAEAVKSIADQLASLQQAGALPELEKGEEE